MTHLDYLLAHERVANRSKLPVLFIVDHDKTSLHALLSDLSRRFGNDFVVRGETSSSAALAVLRELADADVPVALLLVADAASDVLTCGHELHPSAKRVLLVDRDYSSTSPAVQAMTLGRADYHIVRPWADEESAVPRHERVPLLVDERAEAAL